MSITGYQVVLAQTRGDSCYEGKTGWYYHAIDDATAIIESSVTGPYDTVTAASAACLAAREAAQ